MLDGATYGFREGSSLRRPLVRSADDSSAPYLDGRVDSGENWIQHRA
jgi:hypothetical protein